MKPDHRALLLLVMLSVSWLSGCGKADTQPGNVDSRTGDPSGPKDGDRQVGAAAGEHGHSHERGKMLLADVGSKYHALLTAHLSSKDGNELDVFFETAEGNSPAPAAIPVESLTAHVKVAGEDHAREVKFVPAPMAERPRGEKAGACSHFVARVPWMRAGDSLNVVVLLTLQGERYRVAWESFSPKKYAHHEE